MRAHTHSFPINSDGKVSLCLDWGRKLVVGDVNNSSLLDMEFQKRVIQKVFRRVEGNTVQFVIMRSDDTWYAR